MRHPLLHLNITEYMYTSTFLRAQLDLNIFLPARVRAFFVIRVLRNGLFLLKRYVPSPEGKSCTYIYIYILVVSYHRPGSYRILLSDCSAEHAIPGGRRIRRNTSEQYKPHLHGLVPITTVSQTCRHRLLIMSRLPRTVLV